MPSPHDDNITLSLDDTIDNVEVSATEVRFEITDANGRVRIETVPMKQITADGITVLRPTDRDPTAPPTDDTDGPCGGECTCGQGVTPDQVDEATDRSVRLITAYLTGDDNEGIAALADATHHITAGVAYSLGMVAAVMAKALHLGPEQVRAFLNAEIPDDMPEAIRDAALSLEHQHGGY